MRSGVRMRIGRGGWGSAGPTSAGAGSESLGLERALRKVGGPIPTVRRTCKQPSDRSSAASADQETLDWSDDDRRSAHPSEPKSDNLDQIVCGPTAVLDLRTLSLIKFTPHKKKKRNPT
jgi:hypothetical protein